MLQGYSALRNPSSRIVQEALPAKIVPRLVAIPVSQHAPA